MESFNIELYPNVGQAHIALFDNVTNASDLRQRLLSQDKTLQCALVNASLVYNTIHALLAINRAVNLWQQNQLKTHNIHSEIVFDFSNSVNIAQSLRRYGIDDQSQQLLVIKIGGTSSEVEKFMRDNIQGELIPLSQLEQIRDLKKIKKYYQLGDQAENQDKIMSLISGSMAMKGL
ncbi:unnamed protein product [Cunninghamella blakesleeana]